MTAQASFSDKIAPRYPSYKRFGGFQKQQGRCDEGKTFLPVPRIEASGYVSRRLSIK
jgi:hypothetical protein